MNGAGMYNSTVGGMQGIFDHSRLLVSPNGMIELETAEGVKRICWSSEGCGVECEGRG